MYLPYFVFDNHRERRMTIILFRGTFHYKFFIRIPLNFKNIADTVIVENMQKRSVDNTFYPNIQIKGGEQSWLYQKELSCPCAKVRRP